MQHIQATKEAFAAILADGSVVTWGHCRCGGDSSRVQERLKGVQQVQATSRAFSAILDNGSVVSWSDASAGGDSSYLEDQLKGVQQIQAASYSLAAVLHDGSVVTWGNRPSGGNSRWVAVKGWNLRYHDRDVYEPLGFLKHGNLVEVPSPAAQATLSKSSSRTCAKSRLRAARLLPYGAMALW